MKKQEVLTLLEKFPDLVDSDELIQDLFHEAASDPQANYSKPESDRRPSATQAGGERIFDRRR
ncbi:MAG TPA: hypothetical protein VHX65_20145 [Pirellulales bacterium]|nr:hypothetical protein [Pirellulales bacterium]